MADSFKKYEQNERMERLEKCNTFHEAEKLIFEWVKTGKVNVREMTELVNYNRHLDEQG